MKTCRAGRMFMSHVENQGWLMEEQVEELPPAATLENPPGDDEVGSAWHLPESSVERKFNTCSFQKKQKTRWSKPGQFAGRFGRFGRVGEAGQSLQVPSMGQTWTVAGEVEEGGWRIPRRTRCIGGSVSGQHMEENGVWNLAFFCCGRNQLFPPGILVGWKHVFFLPISLQQKKNMSKKDTLGPWN